MLNLSTYQKIYNKLRWYLQPPQRFIFTNLSEACCEAKPRPSPEPSPEPPDLELRTEASHTFSGTFARTLLNVTWLCTKASQTFSGTFSGTFSRTLLNVT